MRIRDSGIDDCNDRRTVRRPDVPRLIRFRDSRTVLLRVADVVRGGREAHDVVRFDRLDAGQVSIGFKPALQRHAAWEFDSQKSDFVQRLHQLTGADSPLQKVDAYLRSHFDENFVF